MCTQSEHHMNVCLICRYFEARSQFCRKNPPVPLLIPDENGYHVMSAYPKISCPTLDWCSQFENIRQIANDKNDDISLLFD